MPYTHLTSFERMMIELRYWDGVSMRAIAAAMGRHPSTVYREIRRNSGPRRRYRAVLAQEAYRERRTRPQALRSLQAPRRTRSSTAARCAVGLTIFSR